MQHLPVKHTSGALSYALGAPHSLDHFPENTLFITHMDLDGLGGPIVFLEERRLLREKAPRSEVPVTILYQKNPNSLAELASDPDWIPYVKENFGQVLISDLAPTLETLRALNAAGILTMVVDHHPHAMGVGSFVYSDDSPYISYHHVEGISATLAWANLFTKTLSEKSHPEKFMHYTELIGLGSNVMEFAEAVSAYDTGKWGPWNAHDMNSLDNALKLQIIFSTMCKTEDDYFTFIEGIWHLFEETSDATLRQPFSDALNRGFSTLAFQMELVENTAIRTSAIFPLLDSAFKVQRRLEVAFMPITIPQLSMVSKQYLIDHQEVEIFIAMDTKRNQLQLRSRDDGPDCGELARLMGGNGHPRAAGCPIGTDARALISTLLSRALLITLS